MTQHRDKRNVLALGDCLRGGAGAAAVLVRVTIEAEVDVLKGRKEHFGLHELGLRIGRGGQACASRTRQPTTTKTTRTKALLLTVPLIGLSLPRSFSLSPLWTVVVPCCEHGRCIRHGRIKARRDSTHHLLGPCCLPTGFVYYAFLSTEESRGRYGVPPVLLRRRAAWLCHHLARVHVE